MLVVRMDCGTIPIVNWRVRGDAESMFFENTDGRSMSLSDDAMID